MSFHPKINLHSLRFSNSGLLRVSEVRSSKKWLMLGMSIKPTGQSHSQPVRLWMNFGMTRELIPTPAFKRSFRKFLRRNPQCADSIERTLDTLAVDDFASHHRNP
jgi:hypothetical protein